MVTYIVLAVSSYALPHIFTQKYEQTKLYTCLSVQCKFSPALPQQALSWQGAQAPGTLPWPHTWEKPINIHFLDV